METGFLALPYEIKAQILSEAIGVSFDFLFLSPVQVRGWRERYGGQIRKRNVRARMYRAPCFLKLHIRPVRVPTAYLLVSSKFSSLVASVASGMDKLAPKLQDKINYSFVTGGLPPRLSDETECVFNRLWDAERPGRIVLGGYPINPVRVEPEFTISVKSLYLTKAMTRERYPGVLTWWDFGSGWLGLFFKFPNLENLAIGVPHKLACGRSKYPISQALWWLMEDQRRNSAESGSTDYRRLELIFEKKGKKADAPLELDTYQKPPSGYKWVKRRLDDRSVSKRGRYVNEWDYWRSTEIHEVEEGDVWQVELSPISD